MYRCIVLILNGRVEPHGKLGLVLAKVERKAKKRCKAVEK